MPAATFKRTWDAVARFQSEVLGIAHPDRVVSPGGVTARALDAAVALPSALPADPLGSTQSAAAVTTRQGVRITRPVGNLPARDGNRPDDLRAVQRRLVELGHLPAEHGEEPAAGATAGVAPARIPGTRAAIRAFQVTEVGYWRTRGEIAGAVAAAVVGPRDATHTLLDRIASHEVDFPDGTRIALRDWVRSQYTVTVTGVSYFGSAGPEALTADDYRELGLSPAQAAALAAVSAHEGRFDALNTYDQARVSFGFIQFAGGRGLPPMMARIRGRRPDAFARVFGDFGIDVEYNVSGERVDRAALVVRDAVTGNVARGVAAEEAIRDSPRLSAIFIRAGRHPEIQRSQVEAATRDYLIESLTTEATYDADVVEVLDAPGGAVTELRAGAVARAFRAGAAYRSLHKAGRVAERSATTGASLGALFKSEQGIAVLLDRAVQEGAGAEGAGTGRLVGAVRWVADARGLLDVLDVRAHERAVTQQVADDFAADIAIAGRIDAASAALARLVLAGRAANATVDGVIAHADLGAARRAIDAAIAAAARKSLTTRAGARWPTRAQIDERLRAERRRLDFKPKPAKVKDLTSVAEDVATRVAAVRPPSADAELMRKRVTDLLASELEAAPA